MKILLIYLSTAFSIIGSQQPIEKNYFYTCIDTKNKIISNCSIFTNLIENKNHIRITYLYNYTKTKKTIDLSIKNGYILEESKRGTIVKTHFSNRMNIKTRTRLCPMIDTAECSLIYKKILGDKKIISLYLYESVNSNEMCLGYQCNNCNGIDFLLYHDLQTGVEFIKNDKGSLRLVALIKKDKTLYSKRIHIPKRAIKFDSIKLP